MSLENRHPQILLASVGALTMSSPALRACTACYGQSDAPMAQGMNWGIFSLLAVVVVVLSAGAGFFVYLGRRAAAVPMEGTPGGRIGEWGASSCSPPDSAEERGKTF